MKLLLPEDRPAIPSPEQLKKSEQRIQAVTAVALLSLLGALLAFPPLSLWSEGSSGAMALWLIAAFSGTALLYVAVVSRRLAGQVDRLHHESVLRCRALTAVTSAAVMRLARAETLWCNHPGRLSSRGVELFDTARKVASALEQRTSRVESLLESRAPTNVAQAYSLLSKPLRIEDTSYSPLIFIDLAPERKDLPLLDPILCDLFERLEHEIARVAELCDSIARPRH